MPAKCPHCKSELDSLEIEIVLAREGNEDQRGLVTTVFTCPNCHAALSCVPEPSKMVEMIQNGVREATLEVLRASSKARGSFGA